MKRNFMRKAVTMLTCSALAGGLLAGCGGGAKSDSTAASGDGGELNFFVWTEYVPDSVIQTFEDETGIKVNVTTYSSNEDMLAKVKAEDPGTYDVVVPSDYMLKQMISQDMLEELDKDQLPNLKNIGDEYLDQDFDPGNKYSVPYLGGVATIAVNTAKVKTKITSYDDLFNPELKGQIVALDDYRAVIGMTERSMGLSMNETDPDKLAEVEEKLLTLKDNIAVYDSDSPKSSLISGDCNVGFVWGAEIALAQEENPDIQVVYPDEGCYIFLDGFAIPKGAKNKDNALKFINYMLDGKTNMEVLKEFPYLSPNKVAVEEMGEDYASNEAKNPPAEVIEKGEHVDNLDPDTLAILDNMWTKLKQ